jgi:DNA-binding MarR family transcriptional regulator
VPPGVAQQYFVLMGLDVTKAGKYVNMADIISKRELSDAETVTLIELLFFAYRDFVSDPDQLLAEIGFGRAHHRVVHFVGRDPGLTVAQLLDILRITKQSLGRVLKDLIDKGFVYQKEGEADRRQRLLYLTAEGEDLRQKLMAPQMERIRRAAAETNAGGGPRYRDVLFHLISPSNRNDIRNWLERVNELGGEGERGE